MDRLGEFQQPDRLLQGGPVDRQTQVVAAALPAGAYTRRRVVFGALRFPLGRQRVNLVARVLSRASADPLRHGRVQQPPDFRGAVRHKRRQPFQSVGEFALARRVPRLRRRRCPHALHPASQRGDGLGDVRPVHAAAPSCAARPPLQAIPAVRPSRCAPTSIASSGQPSMAGGLSLSQVWGAARGASGQSAESCCGGVSAFGGR